MLDIETARPTIRNAIVKRLSQERGIAIADIQMIPRRFKKHPERNHLQVGVWLILLDCQSESGIVDVRSFFDLPREFEHAHLLNEIDEIAESVKKARVEASLSVIRSMPVAYREALPGTGLRGRWQNGEVVKA